MSAALYAFKNQRFLPLSFLSVNPQTEDGLCLANEYQMLFPGKCVCSFDLTVIAYVVSVVSAKNCLARLLATGPLF